MDLNYIDQFFSEQEHQIIHDYCLNAEYSYGERDDANLPITGMVHNIPETEFVYKLIKKRLNDSAQQVQGKKLYRMYVNCFVPGEQPYFHTDGDEGVTFIYYPNMKWDKDDGGETQFLMKDDLYGVLPIPNRMVVFSANLLHRATSFRNDHRFTVAIKYM